MTAILTDLAGVIDDLDEATYHQHPALSVSGAKKLLDCPAKYRHDMDHGQAPRAVFDIGHAAHALVLGVGAEILVVAADDWRSKAAREARDAAYAEGKIPLLAADKAAVDGMAAALRQHPRAGTLLEPGTGRAELSLFWRDWVTGVHRRGRLDWFTAHEGRPTIVDYKTCASAEPGQVRRAVANFGYHQQHAWYVDAAHAVELADEARFLFVFQEKSAPYLVTVVELDGEAVRVGRARNDEALRVFAACEASGVWPGYADDVQVVSLPQWAQPREGWDPTT